MPNCASESYNTNVELVSLTRIYLINELPTAHLQYGPLTTPYAIHE